MDIVITIEADPNESVAVDRADRRASGAGAADERTDAAGSALRAVIDEDGDPRLSDAVAAPEGYRPEASEEGTGYTAPPTPTRAAAPPARFRTREGTAAGAVGVSDATDFVDLSEYR